MTTSPAPGSHGSVPPSIQLVADALNRHGVPWLLMGGQACVAYGASEFSRDVDIVVVTEVDAIERLGAALDELDADVIAVPPFDIAALKAGLAVHFRCKAPGVVGLRVDVMARMRGVDAFADLWRRRTVLASGLPMLSIPDLVAAKKTQRDKDWPMIRRLIEADYFARRGEATTEDIGFWLAECRTPELIRELAERFPEAAATCRRPALLAVRAGHTDDEVERLLEAEVRVERAADRAHWAPLKRELERMRLERKSRPDG